MELEDDIEAMFKGIDLSTATGLLTGDDVKNPTEEGGPDSE
jgi:hypothetical protein